jgi:hypothetical protein
LYGAFLEQPLDDLVVAPSRYRLQCAAIVSALCVDVGSLFEQPLDDLVMALSRCRMLRFPFLKLLPVFNEGLGLEANLTT